MAGLGVQRAGGDGQAATVTQRHLVAVILARGEATGDHLAPQLTEQRLAQQLAGCRVGFAHQPLVVDHHHPAGQQVEQVLQAVGQALLLVQFSHALGTYHGQLALELADAGFEHAVGLVELGGYLVEQGECLLQPLSTLLFDRGTPLRIKGSGKVGGLGHRALSRG
ncbi:hypothetical protein D3C76_1382990 [compost metagenome]